MLIHRGVGKSLWKVTCYAKNGRIKWVEERENTQPTVLSNDILDVYYRAQTQRTSWFIGLKGTGSAATTDTLASHGGWSEVNPYSGNRPAFTINGAAAAGAISNSSSKASYAITGSATVAGMFMSSVNTGTSGILGPVVDFSGSRSVVSGDTLNVQVDISQA